MEVTVNLYPRFDNQYESRATKEKYEPAMGRLNSIEKFNTFCDSVYGSSKIAQQDSGMFANLVSRVIQYRFIHGYTWYHFGHNYIAKLLAPLLHKNISLHRIWHGMKPQLPFVPDEID